MEDAMICYLSTQSHT